MFEHFIHHQRIDPRRRARLIASAHLSASLVTGLLLFGWVGDKLQIARVDPPTVDYVLFQLTATQTHAAPPPPPPLGTPEADEQEREPAPEEEPVPIEEFVAPDDTPRKIPTPKRAGERGLPTGQDGGVPLGDPRGVLHSVGVGMGAGVGTPSIAVREPAGHQARAPEPISAVMSRCDYCPDPNTDRLHATKTGMFNRRSGTNRTEFCVEPDGSIGRVRTVKRFPDDPKIDAICRDAVKRWRVRPLRVGGRAVRSCSTVTFDLDFSR